MLLGEGCVWPVGRMLVARSLASRADSGVATLFINSKKNIYTHPNLHTVTHSCACIFHDGAWHVSWEKERGKSSSSWEADADRFARLAADRALSCHSRSGQPPRAARTGANMAAAGEHRIGLRIHADAARFLLLLGLVRAQVAHHDVQRGLEANGLRGNGRGNGLRGNGRGPQRPQSAVQSLQGGKRRLGNRSSRTRGRGRGRGSGRGRGRRPVIAVTAVVVIDETWLRTRLCDALQTPVPRTPLGFEAALAGGKIPRNLCVPF